MSDYIKLHRSLLEWKWYSDINTTRLFIHMLLKANWKEGNFKGKIIPRGSFVSSLGKLADETELSLDEVRTALKHLISTKEVTKQSYSKYTVFTVKNYDCYQDVPKQLPNEIPSKSQAIPNLFPTIEEGKNNNITCSRVERFDEFWENYPKQQNILGANKEYMLALFNDQSLTEQDLITAARNYSEAVAVLGIQERFIKNPDRFLSEGRYIDYLDKNYKKPDAPKPKSRAPAGQFNQFMKNDYDMDELERELLSN